MATLDRQNGAQVSGLTNGQKITPSLWFNQNAEEAIGFYISIFKNSSIKAVTRYGENEHGTPGSVLGITFELEGQQFFAINADDHYKFTGAISFLIDCKDQQEIDFFWEKLADGGEEQQCGWLTDRFGVTWQVAPQSLNELIFSTDPVKAKNAMEAMFKMKKLDIRLLQDAHDKE